MSDTIRFNLPLLDAAQAQKHVTLNEALVRADALAAGRVETLGAGVPPASPVDGEAHVVGAGATGGWAGQDDAVALWVNGGWVFVAPWSGLRLWHEAGQTVVTWRDGAWHAGAQAGSQGGAASFARIAEIDHVLGAGATSTTAAIIPDKAVVIGVTGRVTTAIAGATSWSLGVSGAASRYGSGYGVTVGAFAHGVSSQPQAYYGGSALLVTAGGGDFSAGAIRLAVHFLEIAPPR